MQQNRQLSTKPRTTYRSSSTKMNGASHLKSSALSYKKPTTSLRTTVGQSTTWTLLTACGSGSKRPTSNYMLHLSRWSTNVIQEAISSSFKISPQKSVISTHLAIVLAAVAELRPRIPSRDHALVRECTLLMDQCTSVCTLRISG